MISLDSLLLTPSGAKRAEEIGPGDDVYIYRGSNMGVQAVTFVKSVSSEAVAIKYYSKNICVVPKTAKVIVSDDRRKHLSKEKQVSDVGRHDLVHRKFVDISMGTADEPHAYSIGALLGDGCCCEGKNAIYISSDSRHIPQFVGEQLGAKHIRKQRGDNYTYIISNGIGCAGNVGHPAVICHHYNKWCKNRKAHQKIVNLDIIKTWNRDSCIRFLSGLLDTDGSIEVDDMRITVNWFSQSKSIIDGIYFIILSLWQTEPLICVDGRSKYVNGPVYKIYVRKNLFSKRILEECSPHLLKKKCGEFVGRTHKACYGFIKPQFICQGEQRFLDFGFDGFFITSNQGVLVRGD